MEKTKAEGYEALRKIEEILEGFDPEETYIGKAFEGCVEQAKENLRYDGKMSWKAEYESKNREVARLTEKLAEVNKNLRESEVTRVDLTKELNQKDDARTRSSRLRSPAISWMSGRRCCGAVRASAGSPTGTSATSCFWLSQWAFSATRTS